MVSPNILGCWTEEVQQPFLLFKKLILMFLLNLANEVESETLT